MDAGFIQPGEMNAGRSVIDVCRILRARRDVFFGFKPNRICGCIEIDESRRAFRINGSYFRYQELVSYTLQEKPEESGRRPGSMLAQGSVMGLALGRSLANRLSGFCNQLCYTLHLTGTFRDAYTVHFITEQTDRNTRSYRDACEAAHECKTGLNYILASNQWEQDARR